MICKILKRSLVRQSFKVSFAQYSTTNSSLKSTLGVLGVPFCKGQRRTGVESAPNALRENGLFDVLKKASNDSLLIKDYGNLTYAVEPETSFDVFNTKNFDEVMGCSKTLIKKVQEILQENDQILTIGGDHAIGFGSVAGHLVHEPDLALVWIDAHADLNLPMTSPSGNAHGMPVAMLIKELRRFWKTAKLETVAPTCLSSDQLVYIGLRSVDPYEAYILERLGIKAYAMDSIDSLGINKVIEMTLDAIKHRNKIHISFDIDALDARIAPSTGTPVEGGLTLREGIRIVEALRETKRVEAFDLTEVNLNLGTKDDVRNTLSASFELLKTLFGKKRGGDSRAIKEDIFKE